MTLIARCAVLATLCSFATAAASDSCLASPQNFQVITDGIEAFVARRMLAFDNEDYHSEDTGYFEAVEANILVEVFVKGKRQVSAKGAEEYKAMFRAIGQSFVDRNVWGFHAMHIPGAFFRLNGDKTITAHVDWDMHERPKDQPDEPKAWKSSGYSRFQMQPMKEGSMDIRDWQLIDYKVYVVETSDDFGKTSDKCDGLC